jgi:hypothetical protein
MKQTFEQWEQAIYAYVGLSDKLFSLTVEMLRKYQEETGNDCLELVQRAPHYYDDEGNWMPYCAAKYDESYGVLLSRTEEEYRDNIDDDEGRHKNVQLYDLSVSIKYSIEQLS